MNKTNLGLVIAILCLSTFYTWSKFYKLEVTDKKYQNSRYYPKLEDKDVEAIKVESKDPAFEYTLRRIADHWYINDNLLNIEKAHQLVHSVLELTMEREIEPEPDSAQEKEYQLDSPSYRLEPFKNGGESFGAVRLGARTPDYNQFYGQWEKGGAVSTVPAYTFSVLEEKPKDLIEMSLFPVEVAAVKLLTLRVGKLEPLVLKRLADSTLYEFEKSTLGKVDESAVKDFLSTLHDTKVARFLAPQEKVDFGDVEFYLAAEVGYTKAEIVTELFRRVDANAALMYGRRFFRDKVSGKPVEGTMERFVVEIPTKSELLKPDEKTFVERRVAVFDLNKVTMLSLELDGKGEKIAQGKHGKWQDSSAKEVTQDRLNGVLWTLRDLRTESEWDGEPPVESPNLVLMLEGDGFSKLELRFGMEKSGKPYLRRGTQTYLLSENSWNAIIDAVKKFMAAS